MEKGRQRSISPKDEKKEKINKRAEKIAATDNIKRSVHRFQSIESNDVRKKKTGKEKNHLCIEYVAHIYMFRLESK